MKPRFDDRVKRPNGEWVSSHETDITVSWKKAREKFEAERKRREEALKVVRQIREVKSEPNQTPVLGRHPKGAA
jgi:hypothetical protein